MKKKERKKEDLSIHPFIQPRELSWVNKNNNRRKQTVSVLTGVLMVK